MIDIILESVLEAQSYPECKRRFHNFAEFQKRVLERPCLPAQPNNKYHLPPSFQGPSKQLWILARSPIFNMLLWDSHHWWGRCYSRPCLSIEKRGFWTSPNKVLFHFRHTHALASHFLCKKTIKLIYLDCVYMVIYQFAIIVELS